MGLGLRLVSSVNVHSDALWLQPSKDPRTPVVHDEGGQGRGEM